MRVAESREKRPPGFTVVLPLRRREACGSASLKREFQPTERLDNSKRRQSVESRTHPLSVFGLPLSLVPVSRCWSDDSQRSMAAAFAGDN